MRLHRWDLSGPTRVPNRREAWKPSPILCVPGPSPSPPVASLSSDKKAASNFSSSPPSIRPHRNDEAISESPCPYIFVADAAELPAVVRGEFQSIREVVVHTEFELLGIHGRERIANQLSRKKLLISRDQLGSTHFVLQERKLAQFVRGLQPVAAAPFRTRVLPTNIQGQFYRLPNGVKPK